MTGTITMQKVLDIAGVSRDQVNKWAERNHLRYFPATKQGARREFDRQAALEVAFIAALTRGGMNVENASRMASFFSVQAQIPDQLAPYWFYNPRTGRSNYFGADLKTSSLMQALPDSVGSGWVDDETDPHFIKNEGQPASEIFIVCLREIVERVDTALRVPSGK